MCVFIRNGDIWRQISASMILKKSFSLSSSSDLFSVSCSPLTQSTFPLQCVYIGPPTASHQLQELPQSSQGFTINLSCSASACVWVSNSISFFGKACRSTFQCFVPVCVCCLFFCRSHFCLFFLSSTLNSNVSQTVI